MNRGVYRTQLLRVRGEHELGRATFIELFFDLVFVFAVTQLSHTLLAQFTLVGAVETLVLLVAMWWVWINATWATNWLDPHQVPVRLLLLALMLLGLLFSAAIPQPFQTRGIIFAAAYVLTQLGLTLFVLWAFQHNLVQRRNFQPGTNDARIIISVLGGPALYLLGNLLFKWAIARRVRSSHLLGMGVLVVLIPVADAVSPVTLLIAATVLLVGIAVWKAYTKRRHTDPRSIDVRLGHG